MFRRFAGDTSGNIAILFSLLFGTMSVAAALAIDMAALNLEKRRIQGAVDLAAIAAAGNPANAFAIAAQVIRDQGLVPADMSVEELSLPNSIAHVSAELGNYRPDRSIPPEERFTANSGLRNAVRVTYRKQGELFFAAPWSEPPAIAAQAVASAEGRVAFSLGTGAAALGEGLPNALLNRLLGTSVQLRAVDYNALASVRLDALRFLDALAVRLDLTAGTYSDVLNAQATQSQIGGALADVVDAADRLAIQGVLQQLGNKPVRVGNLIGVGGLADNRLGSARGQVEAAVSALDVVRASAILADGTKYISLPVSVSFPGIATFTAEAAIGEPMQGSGWFALGEVGASVRSAQVRVLVKATIPGILALLPISLDLPIYIEVAQSEARLVALTCPSAASPYGTATLQVMPGLARVRVGNVLPNTLADFSAAPATTPAKILNVLNLIVAYAIADVQVSQTSAVTVPFSSNDIRQRVIKTASTRTIVGSLSASLFGQTRIWLDLLRIPLLSESAALATIGGLLTPVAPVLDGVINGLMKVLGISVGLADVTVHGVTCSAPTLKS